MRWFATCTAWLDARAERRNSSNSENAREENERHDQNETKYKHMKSNSIHTAPPAATTIASVAAHQKRNNNFKQKWKIAAREFEAIDSSGSNQPLIFTNTSTSCVNNGCPLDVAATSTHATLSHTHTSAARRLLFVSILIESARST